MAAKSYEDQILDQIRKLDNHRQRQVLEFARTLGTRPRGISGREAIAVANKLNFNSDDLLRMKAAIEDACES